MDVPIGRYLYLRVGMTAKHILFWYEYTKLKYLLLNKNQHCKIYKSELVFAKQRQIDTIFQ